MLRENLVEILKKMSPQDITKCVLTLKYNAAITLDSVARYEEDYLVIRGREAGTNDEGRAFFVPFDDVVYIKLDRVVTVNEMKRLYGEKVEDAKSVLDPNAEATPETKTSETKPASPAAAPPAMDPAGIAKQNLLARIRAARNGATTATTAG